MAGDVAFPFDEWVYRRTLVDSPLVPSERGVMAAALDALPHVESPELRYARATQEGHLWISASKAPGGGRAMEWRVVDLQGREVARLTTPTDFTLHDVGPNWVLGVWRDSLDVEFIQLYALQRPAAREAPGLAEAVARWSGSAPTFQRVAGAAAEAASETLKMMAGSEEMFYSRRGHYTPALDSLREVNPRFIVPETVRLSPLWVEDNGWMYMALETVADATCIISFGFVHLMGRPPGEIACWSS